MSELVQCELSPQDIKNNIRESLDFLAAVVNSEESISPFPPFYLQVWALIFQQLLKLDPGDVFRFALGLPRGHVKTTFIKLLIIYLILHDYKVSFFLVVCATEPLAENFLADVQDMLETPIIQQIYGDWKATLSKDTKKLVVSKGYQGRPVILAAIGAQTSVRGLVVNNKRPQVIVCDDVQKKENDESDTERRQLLRWLTGTLFKARSKTSRTAIIYIGNLYSDECILAQLSNNPHWVSLITGAILATGEALWPEINTIEQLIEEFNHDNALGEGATWFAEVQNDPIGAGTGLLDAGDIIPPANSSIPLDIYPIRWICIDPAGDKKTSDDNVIGCHALMQDSEAVTIRKEWGKWNPEKVIETALGMAMELRVGIIFIESNAYQGTLAFWMDKYRQKLGLDIRIVLLPSGAQSKYQRIKTWVKALTSGQWHVYRQSDLNAIAYQIYKYKIEKSNNVDDILDEEAMALMALNKHYKDILQATPLEDEAVPQARVRRNNSVLDYRRH